MKMVLGQSDFFFCICHFNNKLFSVPIAIKAPKEIRKLNFCIYVKMLINNNDHFYKKKELW